VQINVQENNHRGKEQQNAARGLAKSAETRCVNRQNPGKEINRQP
jgi:hypothetical protein